MRKLLLVPLLFALYLVCSSSGCKHDSGLNVTPTNTPTTGNNGSGVTPASGDWIVTYFNDKGTDMSDHLNGYTFNFQADGKLVVNTGLDPVSGTWASKTDDNKKKFIISLVGADPMLAELNEDWLIKSSTATELDLTHGNGSSGQEVHFTKK